MRHVCGAADRIFEGAGGVVSCSASPAGLDQGNDLQIEAQCASPSTRCRG